VVFVPGFLRFSGFCAWFLFLDVGNVKIILSTVKLTVLFIHFLIILYCLLEFLFFAQFLNYFVPFTLY